MPDEPSPPPVLILGGTSEANALGRALHEAAPHCPVVLSLAGRTRHPVLPPQTVSRTGGFGGADGLAAYLHANAIAAVVDATHPFADRISENARQAARLTSIPLLRLTRPQWSPREGDHWIRRRSEAEAVMALPRGARPFVALGSQHLAALSLRPDIRPVARMIEPPSGPLPPTIEIVFAKPAADAGAERDLFASLGVTHLVCRNSGGSASYAKIEAARGLALPVIMIERRSCDAETRTTTEIGEAVDWVLGHLRWAHPVSSRRSPTSVSDFALALPCAAMRDRAPRRFPSDEGSPMPTTILDRETLSVRAILEGIDAGAVTAEDAIAESARRISAGDADLKAFVHLAQSPRPAQQGGLAGVSVGVKDIFDTADMPTEMGSALYKGHQPRFDAPLVAMARSQGATIMGKTATTELASLDPTDTQNPAAPGHTPGGSSSGSAASVAAGFCAAAYGSQTGGSVIRPASFCGIAGFKPSFRLLPTVGMKTFSWSLDTAGLFARSVDDLALFAALLTGRELAMPALTDLSGLTLGFYRTSLDTRIEPEMAAALESLVALLEGQGARIVDVSEPAALEEGRQSHTALQGYEAARALHHEFHGAADRMGAKVRGILADGQTIDAVSYDAARRSARVARKAANALFESVDGLISASAFGPPPKGLGSTGDPTIAKLWTLTGNPVVNIPGLSTTDGLPLGISLITRFGRDARALAIASAIERTIAGRTGSVAGKV
ncbi:cobalt-precorrin-6A reductase [Fulvimarina endophytica]|nr:cobalt-precorrin-6A reductase [Fulvimarina endophytica]